MNIKTEDIILYDNHYSRERELFAKENLLINNPELYKSMKDIPPRDIDNALYWLDLEEWQNIQTELEVLFKQDDYLLIGYFGSWKGRIAGGKFIRHFKELQKAISHLEYIRIIDRNGHLLIEGSHHDGNDCYELKRLTKKGIELASCYNFEDDRKLHSTIMQCNFYSALPNFAKKVYCV